MKPLKILFVSHDASRTGAPIILLNICKWLKENGDIQFEILLLGRGALMADFKKVGKTYLLDLKGRNKENLYSKVKNELVRSYLNFRKFDLVYINTVASVSVLPLISAINDVPKILHVHELSISIKQYCNEMLFNEYAGKIDKFIAASDAVKQNLIKSYNLSEGKIELIYEPINLSEIENSAVGSLKEVLGLSSDAFVVGGSGTRDWRKGFDLFLMAPSFINNKNIHFVWVGGRSSGLELAKINYDLERLGLSGRVHLIEVVDNPMAFYKEFDLFFLSSREDPFPLVCLENAACGNPIVCFNDSGGMPEFVKRGAGKVIPYGDFNNLNECVSQYYSCTSMLADDGRRAQELVQTYDIHEFIKSLKNVLDDHTKT
ncbi:MAG: glycosyltransferase [Cyclobacteriaceae bacterium]